VTVAATVAALLLAASTSTTPAPTATAAAPSAAVWGSSADAGTAVTFPVEDVTGVVEDLVFASASTDGAVTDTGDRDFRLNSDVLFAFDKAVLNARAKREIARIATVLGTGKKVTRVMVTGYTDDVGSDAYNVKLSQRRAAAVKAALGPQLGGVSITAAGRGEADPVARNDSDRHRSLNRRVEIRGA
jgi:outer membrane protein OmpA-like peptidoglycan-associated protein